MPKMSLNVADPKANVREAPHTAGVGNERKADMSVVGDNSLRGAMKHLADDHGPAGRPNHMPLHGLTPKRG